MPRATPYTVGASSEQDWLRINITSVDNSLYCIIKKIILQVNTINDTFVLIETDKNDQWQIIQAWQALDAWNCINLNETFGADEYGTNCFFEGACAHC